VLCRGRPSAGFLIAQGAFTERVHAIADDQWQLGTPDAQWTVADLVWHLTDEHRWAGPLLAGLDMDQARAALAGLGPADGDGVTGVREWDLAAAMSAGAFRADGALSGSVAITRGPAPVAEYLEEMILDLIVHAGTSAPRSGTRGRCPPMQWRPFTRWPGRSLTGRPPACSTHRSRSVPTRPSWTSLWR
jgi:uncharacterized protein (TIGR03086 family)